MKKFRFFALICIIIASLAAFAACSQSVLSSPTGVLVDENYRMSWNGVPGARGYVIEATNTESGEVKELSSAKTSISLSSLSEGYYDVRVKAKGTTGTDTDSDWSETVNFHRDYETGCVYTLINNGTEYEISRFGTASGEVFIEAEYRNKPVTSIAQRAFKNCASVEIVHIGKNVRSIGENAFYGCKELKKVVIPEDNSLTYIGGSAFVSCVLLESVEIPENVTEIFDSTFAYCRSLKEITIHDKITHIGEFAFSDCIGLTKVNIPDSVTNMDVSVFAGCTGLTEVTIGSGLTVLPDSTFQNCTALKKINFSDSGNLTAIGRYAFGDCTALESVTIPEGVTSIGRWAFIMQADEEEDPETGETAMIFSSLLSEVNLPSTVTSIGANAFFGAKFFIDAYLNEEAFIYADDWVVGASGALLGKLEKIKVDSFKSETVGIAEGALSGCPLLETMELPYSVKYIGPSAFAECLKLRSVETYKNSVVSIGENAFNGCKILSSLILGDGVESIGAGAFMNCERLDNSESNVLCPETVKSVGTKAFLGTRLWTKPDEYGVVYANNWIVGYSGNISSVDVSSKAVGIADYAFANSTLRTLVIPNTNELKYLGKGAFYNCESLDMPDFGSTSIREIPDYAFYYCQSMSTIGLPLRLTKIGRSAFYSCNQLTEISLSGRKVSYIGENAFFNCLNLQSFNFGSDLTEIGPAAFYQCVALSEANLPGSVTKIGNHAFFKCHALTEISLGSKVTEVGTYAFTYCISLKKVDLGSAVTKVGPYAFYGCREMVILKLGKNLESIGDYAFFGLSKLASLELPASLKSIGAHAFHGCSSVESVTVGANVSEMGAHAFYGCNSVTIFVEEGENYNRFDEAWNTSFRPVISGVTLSEEGYVESVTAGKNALLNGWAESGIATPTRSGYEFKGFSLQPEGEAEYALSEIGSAPEGATLYAVWDQKN